MGTKKNNTDEKSLQDYFMAEDESEDVQLEGEDPNVDADSEDEVQLEFGPDHPYYEEPNEDDDDDPAPAETPKGKSDDKPKPKEEPDPKDNPDRHEYWQSQHDKLAAQNEKLMKMLEKQTGSPEPEEQPKSPVDTLREKEQELAGLTIPEKPKRPEGYSATDAYTDPDSASFKYRAQLDDWNEEYISISQKKDQLKDEVYNMKLKQVEEPLRKMTNEKQLSAEQQKVVATLKKDHNFTPEQATDFIAEMSKPESMSLDNLARYYRHIKGVKSPDAQESTKTKEKGNRSPKREAAPPIPLGSGAGPSVDDEDDEATLGRNFGAGLLNFNR